jgi:hypothetical protein
MASITGVSNASARETHSPQSIDKASRASKRNARADNLATFTLTEFGPSACLETSLDGGAARGLRATRVSKHSVKPPFKIVSPDFRLPRALTAMLA